MTGLGQELGADLAPGGAERPPQPDLRPALQHRDDHDVRHPDRTCQQGDRSEAQEQPVQRALGIGAGGERGRRLAHVDLVGILGIGRLGQHGLHRGDLAGLGAHVDRGGWTDGLARIDDPGVVEVALRGGKADKHARVDLGREQARVEDAGDVEPLAPDPDPLAGVDPVDAHPLRGRGAEHRHRLGRGDRVQVGTLRHGRRDHRQQVQAGGVDGDRVGVDARD
jgi:hypothetical protein